MPSPLTKSHQYISSYAFSLFLRLLVVVQVNELTSIRDDYQFHRQVPIDNYIVDFYCHELKLAIEIDGITHDFKYDLDQHRQRKLETFGVCFIRFQERDVRKNTEGVVLTIQEWIRQYEKMAK